MDSKIVNSQIKKRIWPILKSAGFSVFTQRTAWRHHEDRIDVLNFQSFNSYNADVIGCTTYSFQVNLGCYLKAIPPQFEPSRIKLKGDDILPQEFECHFRGRLLRTFEQPALQGNAIWYVDPEGKNLGWVVTDVEKQIQAKAMPWFARFSEKGFALQTLLDAEDEDMDDIWGFGRKLSPRRHYYIGYLALGSDQSQLAHEHLELALASGCYESVEDRIKTDIGSA